MNGHLDDRLFDLALDALAGPDRATAEVHLGQCPRCREELDATRAVVTSLALAATPVAPPPSLREQLLVAAGATAQPTLAGGFSRFAASVAALLDVTADRARALLAKISDPGSWVPGFAPEMSLYHLKGGPATAGLVVGFITLTRGATFPHHRHLGDEWGLVLQGRMLDEDGQVYRPGDTSMKLAETEHSFRAGDDEDLIYLALLRGGLEVGGMVIRADDPRL